MNKRFVFLLLWCAVFSTQHLAAQSAETRFLHRINAMDGRAFTRYNQFVSESEWFVLLGVPLGMGLYDLIKKDRTHLNNTLTLTASLVGVYGLQTLLKETIKRPRPYEKNPGYIIARVDESGYSFPSNHTGGAFALATSLTLQHPKWYVGVPVYLWATAVGFSRMQLGVHYPTDVLAGAVIGSATAYGCHALQKHIIEKRKNKQSRQALLVLQAYHP